MSAAGRMRRRTRRTRRPSWRRPVSTPPRKTGSPRTTTPRRRSHWTPAGWTRCAWPPRRATCSPASPGRRRTQKTAAALPAQEGCAGEAGKRRCAGRLLRVRRAVGARIPKDAGHRATTWHRRQPRCSRAAFFLDEARKIETLPGTQGILFLNRLDAESTEAVSVGKMVELPGRGRVLLRHRGGALRRPGTSRGISPRHTGGGTGTRSSCTRWTAKTRPSSASPSTSRARGPRRTAYVLRLLPTGGGAACPVLRRGPRWPA